MTKVAIVDDHELVRSGLRRLLDDAQGVEVVAEGASGEEAYNIARQQSPDVILLDLKLEGVSGLEATRKISQSYPKVRIIMLTACSDDTFPARLIRAGAQGYLTKGCEFEEVLLAIKTVAKGQRYLTADVAQQLALDSLAPNTSESPFDQLSERELEVATMIAKGERTPNISDRLSLSPKTINTYRYRIFDKLGVKGDVELTHLMIRHGLIDPTDY